MGAIFGKKASPQKAQPNRVTEQDKAVLSLKQQRDKLKQYQKKIQNNMEKERQLAKQLLAAGRKEKAKLLLKKKRYQDNLLAKTDGQMDTIDKMISEVEFAQVEVKVVDGLKQGSEALKQLNALINIEDVERIMDDTKEAIDYQNEISELIGGLSQEDEDDIMAELAGLQEDLDLPEVPVHDVQPVDDRLPDVPVEEPSEPQKESSAQREAVAAM